MHCTAHLRRNGAVTAVCLVVFFVQEAYFRSPNKGKLAFVNLSLFKNWTFDNTVVIGGLAAAAAFGIARLVSAK